MRTILTFVFLLLLVAAAVPMIPLRTAVDLLHLGKFGFAAREIDGNLWSGHLYEATFGKASLGDVTTHMSPGDLVTGRVRLDLEGSDPISALKGGFSFGLGGAGIDGFGLAIPAVGGAPMVPPATIIVEGVSARFPGGECAGASGAARAIVAGAGLSGPVLCREGKLTFDLASDSGREQQQIMMLSARSYRLRALIKATDPALASRLRAAGFAATPEGYSYETERTL
ncbi:MAG: hypothetical protein JWR77_2149 [Rhizorhabdus sp.]|nr:hypothetical protein [Rhizorhabdus sp.]